MLSVLAIADTVGFVGLSFTSDLAPADFFTVSVNIFMNSSRVSGFLVSLPDILSPLCSLCSILYIRVSEKISFLGATVGDFQGKVSVRCSAMFPERLDDAASTVMYVLVFCQR